MHTLFEEGFGVLGGYAGTLFGANVIGLGIVAILGLGPLGLFLTVFICATAGGLFGAELGKQLAAESMKQAITLVIKSIILLMKLSEPFNEWFI